MWDLVDEVEATSGKCQEDRAGRYQNMAWILDGASAVSPMRVTRSASDAAWLVDRLHAELADLAAEPLPLKEIVAEAISRTSDRAAREWINEPDFPPSAALGVVRRAADRTEFLVLADVSVIMTTEAGAVEFTDQRVDRTNTAASRAMRELLEAGHGFGEASGRVREHLAEHRLRAMNRQGGYWVAALDGSAVDHALSGTLDGVEEVVLATDGFMRVLRPFHLIDDVEALFAPGVDYEDLVRLVREAEWNDPDTKEFHRWSVTDDIRAQRLRWIG